MKKVSVLIPLYNCEKYISEAIDSVLKQTYPNIEVIIVDDESKDNSLHIAKKYESEKVKVFTQPHSGAPRARNFAFEVSTGYYIQYLDADDILAPNKIEEQVAILENNGNDSMAFCSYTSDIHDFNTGIYLEQGINKDYDAPIELFIDIFNAKGNIITLCWLTPRALIENSDPWDERLIKAQDGEFFVKMALKCQGIFFSNSTTVYYRPSNSGRITTNHTSKAIESVILSTESVQNNILKLENSNRTRQALVFLYSSIFCTYYNKKNSRQLEKVEANIKDLGGNLVYNGNRYFGLMAKIIGIKNALLLKETFKSFYK